MKKYVLEVTLDENGLRVKSECDGFWGVEVLGFLEWKRDDVVRQLNREIRPDVIVRDIIKED